MASVLILFAHPRLENSRSNKALLEKIPTHSDLTFHDLYDLYPDFNINIEREKEVLLHHDVIIWMHPFYWYSAPPLLKQWIDMVLEFGLAYGPGGVALKDKWIFNSITTGGGPDAYKAGGGNRFTIQEFLRPFDQTATLCKMHYLPPFVVQATHKLTSETLAEKSVHFRDLIMGLLEDKFSLEQLRTLNFLNDLAPVTTSSL
jgi:glutathione-regulated potassium-efflux system ancillary protein KefG